MDKDSFSAIRRQRLAFLVAQNRDERQNELVALQIMTEGSSPATIYDPEDWDFHHAAHKRMAALRRFLGSTPKP